VENFAVRSNASLKILDELMHTGADLASVRPGDFERLDIPIVSLNWAGSTRRTSLGAEQTARDVDWAPAASSRPDIL
jgi:hypothetical protein